MASQMIQMIHPDQIDMDYKRNFRMDYSDIVWVKGGCGLVDSLLHEGLKVKPEITEDRRLLRGFRRLTAIRLIRQHRPDLFFEIPVVVYRGLTPIEERKMVLDHGHVKELNPYETLLAVQELRSLGMGQRSISHTLGMSRSAVQDRFFVLDMPVVLENYRRRYSGEPYVALTHKDVDALHIAHLRGDFDSAWAKLQAPQKKVTRADLEARIDELERLNKVLTEKLVMNNLTVPRLR